MCFTPVHVPTIFAISWRSVLCIEEMGENNRHAEVTDKLNHI